MSYILLKTSIEFSDLRHGAIQDTHPHCPESSNNIRTIGINLSQRKSILRPDTQGLNGHEQVHCLPKHMLCGNKRCVLTKIKVGSPGTVDQRLNYFHQSRLCLNHRLSLVNT